jgi:hypothetical protein
MSIVPTSILDANMRLHISVRDKQTEASEISRHNVASRNLIDSFQKRRIQAIREEDLRASSATKSATLPPPGGVGAGVFFNDDALLFSHSTEVQWYIIVSHFLGGNTRPVLYLTSSNRASKGCEALISYEQGGPAVFRVWDWATQPDQGGSRFVIGLSYTDLSEYIFDIDIEGSPYSVLKVLNRTAESSQNTWLNEVYLLNTKVRPSAFDLVWSFEFLWTPDEAHKYFGWGPIIETFPPYDYGTTNVLGYAETVLVQDLNPHRLTPANSYVRADPGEEFNLVYQVNGNLGTALADYKDLTCCVVNASTTK